GCDLQFCGREIRREGHNRYHRACRLLRHHRNGADYRQRADCARRRAEVADFDPSLPEVIAKPVPLSVLLNVSEDDPPLCMVAFCAYPESLLALTGTGTSE